MLRHLITILIFGFSNLCFALSSNEQNQVDELYLKSRDQFFFRCPDERFLISRGKPSFQFEQLNQHLNKKITYKVMINFTEQPFQITYDAFFDEVLAFSGFGTLYHQWPQLLPPSEAQIKINEEQVLSYLAEMRRQNQPLVSCTFGPWYSDPVTFKENEGNVFVLVHPHSSYDIKGRLNGRLEHYLKSTKYSSYVMLEGLKMPYDSVIEGGSKDPLFTDFRRDITLGTFGRASLHIAGGGYFEYHGTNGTYPKIVTLTGGFEDQCVKNNLKAILKGFSKSQSQQIEIRFPIKDLINSRYQSLAEYLEGLDDKGRQDFFNRKWEIVQGIIHAEFEIWAGVKQVYKSLPANGISNKKVKFSYL